MPRYDATGSTLEVHGSTYVVESGGQTSEQHDQRCVLLQFLRTVLYIKDYN